MHANPVVYAILLGSGASRSASPPFDSDMPPTIGPIGASMKEENAKQLIFIACKCWNKFGLQARPIDVV